VEERFLRELELVVQHYGELEHAPDHTWVIVKKFALPPGWNKATTSVLIEIPAGYPATPPDNFYTDSDLLLAGGNPPDAATSAREFAGRAWRQFSWHLSDATEWQPHADPQLGHNLVTFLSGAEQRLSETN